MYLDLPSRSASLRALQACRCVCSRFFVTASGHVRDPHRIPGKSDRRLPSLNAELTAVKESP